MLQKKENYTPYTHSIPGPFFPNYTAMVGLGNLVIKCMGSNKAEAEGHI